MEMKKTIKGYGLLNGKYFTYNFFYYKRDAVAYAKYQVSNHPGYDWRKSYKVVKAELRQV